MDDDFVVNQLIPAVLFIWGCGFVILTVVYYWRWRRYLRLYIQRRPVTNLLAPGSPWVDSLFARYSLTQRWISSGARPGGTCGTLLSG